MIIGDPRDFAVEYSFADSYPIEMGYGKIWVKDKFIGTNKDLIYLSGYLLNTLYEFKRAKELDRNLRSLTKDQLFDMLFSGEYERSDRYLVRGSTFTDDFSIWAYVLDDKTYFLWKILRIDFFEDLKDYKQHIFLESVLTDSLHLVINKLETEYRDKGILK